jgi:glutamate N-acetyltransferase/amino-acid N-acetyltransferase
MGGIAKGAGMLHPSLATLLCFLSSDAAVDADFLQAALREAVDASFNMLTVDGDTSPNDTVLILANGLAGNEPISGGEPAALFQRTLDEVCLYLAKELVRDAEGATKLIEVVVEGALSLGDAKLAARTIASSPLVKAAIHGSNPNWGRVLAALGRSGASFDIDRMELFLGDVLVFRDGEPVPFDSEATRAFLRSDEVKIKGKLNLGGERAIAWGCDLSPQYVKINSEYAT